VRFVDARVASVDDTTRDRAICSLFIPLDDTDVSPYLALSAYRSVSTRLETTVSRCRRQLLSKIALETETRAWQLTSEDESSEN